MYYKSDVPIQIEEKRQSAVTVGVMNQCSYGVRR